MNIEVSLQPFGIHLSSMHNFENIWITDDLLKSWHACPNRENINYIILFSGRYLYKTSKSLITFAAVLDIDSNFRECFNLSDSLIKFLLSINIDIGHIDIRWRLHLLACLKFGNDSILQITLMRVSIIVLINLDIRVYILWSFIFVLLLIFNCFHCILLLLRFPELNVNS